MPYDQGDIVLVPFPFSDLSDTKLRPAIVVSNADINNSDDVILAAITTNIKNDEYSFKLDNQYLSRSMDRPSEVRCDTLFTCDQTSIIRVISILNITQIEKLTKVIKRSFSTV